MSDDLLDNIKDAAKDVVSSEQGGPTSEMDKMMNEASPGNSGGFLAFVGEMIKVGLIALAIILPVRYFLIKPFYVSGASMVPTYYDGEYLIVDEISYRFNPPSRGEVVVFKYPQDPKQFFIKRIVGLPGERVIVEDGKVVIYNAENPEGLEFKEPYLSNGMVTPPNDDVTLIDGEFYVLGDNRNKSLDSRRFGPLTMKEIVGRTWLRGWPLDRIGVLDHYIFEF